MSSPHNFKNTYIYIYVCMCGLCVPSRKRGILHQNQSRGILPVPSRQRSTESRHTLRRFTVPAAGHDDRAGNGRNGPWRHGAFAHKHHFRQHVQVHAFHHPPADTQLWGTVGDRGGPDGGMDHRATPWLGGKQNSRDFGTWRSQPGLQNREMESRKCPS